MPASNSIQDTLAITHAIHEVARAFDEKLHPELLPQMFTDAAIISPEYRGVVQFPPTPWPRLSRYGRIRQTR